MVIKLAIAVTLAVALILLVRRGLIQVDMSFPWLLAIVALGILSTQPAFVEWAAVQIDIVYAPIAIVFATIFILLGFATTLLIGYTRLRQRQLDIVRRLAALELERQETALRSHAPPAAG
ncbi:MAG: DUF2304 domain-containing protein [Alphaproteobacteria bacterium]|nr:DUF2304 domain-containing protein [Alphaproteobacteria bacterium]